MLVSRAVEKTITHLNVTEQGNTEMKIKYLFLPNWLSSQVSSGSPHV